MSELGADRLDTASRLRRRGVFGAGAERYDRTRPSYPRALFDAVDRYGGLGEGARVLEVGPGTGQATASLLGRGWAVEAVELDPGMAAVLRDRLGDRVRVRVGAFEEAPPPRPPVDLVLSATAYHWLDPAVRLDRIAAALRPGGTLAIVWSRHVRGGTQAFFDAAQACYSRFGGDDPAMDLLPEEDVRPRTAELEASSRFERIEAARFPVEIAYRTPDYLDLLRTYSDTAALPEAARDDLLGCIGALLDDRFEGRAVKRYAFDLVLATRTG